MNFLTGEDLGNLVVRVGLDGTEFDQGLKNVNQRLSLARSELRQSASSFGNFGTATDKLRDKQKHLNTIYELQGTRVLQLRGQYDDLVKVHGKESDAAFRAGTKLNNAITSYQNLGQEIEDVSKELAYQESAWSTASESLEKFSDKAKTVGTNLQTAGKGLTAGVTVPIAALAGTTATAAIQFESAFAGFRKVTDASEEEFANFKQQFRDLSKEIPVTTNEINEVAAAASQLGIKKENVMGFTESMLAMGVASDLTSEQASFAFARIANITNMPQENFDRLGSTVVELGNNFAATESEITEMALRIAGAGSQVGMTEADIMGFSTTLTSVGINAEAGGTAISKLMINIASSVDSGGERLEEFARVAGMSTSEFKKAFEEDAALAIMSFLGGLGDLSEEGESAFKIIDDLGLSEVRLRDTILRSSNARELGNEALATANRAWEENIALQDEADERYGTTESQLVIFWNRLKDIAITLGDTLLPIMNEAMDRAVPFIDYIAELAGKFADLDSDTQLLIIAFAGIVAAIGPVLVITGTLIKSVGLITGAFSTGIAMMGRWRTGAAFTQTSMSRLGTTAAVTSTKVNTANTSIARTGRGMRGLRGAGLAGATGLLMFGDGVAQTAGMALMFLPELAKLGKGVVNVTKSAGKGAARFLGFGKDVAKTGANVAGMATKTAGATKNLGLLARGVGLARTGLAAFGGPVGWAITGVTLLAEGGYHLYKHMKEELVPSLEDFGEGVSEATTEAVLGYKKLNDEATVELNQLLWSGAEVTDEIAESLTSKFSAMGSTITENLKEEFDESKSNLNTFLKDSKVITQKEQDEIYKSLESNLNSRTEVTQNAYNDINRIIETAANENREITAAEQEEINYLQDVMMKQAVRTMSEGEQEQLIIMGRLKEESGNITAQQAAETVQNSVAARDGAVAEAVKKYEEVKAQIEFERDVTGTISAEQADALIAEHRRMKDEAIWNAENMHKGVVEQAQLQAEGHIDAVNWETGEVLTRWDKYVGNQALMMNGLNLGINKILKAFGIDKQIPMWYPNGQKDQGSQQGKVAPTYSKAAGNTGHFMTNEYGTGPSGTTYDGWSMVSEAGSELVHDPKVGTYLTGNNGPEFTYLHKGSSVLPAHHTKTLLQSYGFPSLQSWDGPAYEKGIGDYFDLALQGPKALIDSVWDAVKPASIDGIGGMFVDMAKGVASTLKDGAIDFMTGLMPQISFGGPNFPQPPYRMTSPYGYRTDPVYGGRAFHAGIDYAAVTGTPIPSQSGGKVNFAGWMGGYGNLVRVKSGILEHMYGHNSRNLVKVGDSVSAGQTIALVGSTGKSTGPHVHYEVRKNGKAIDPNSLNAGATGLFDSATGTVKGWLNKAIDITGVPKSWLGPLSTIAQKESGGNPNAINNWDSNARRGTPSMGLMQTIAPTFNAYKGAGMNNINDPVHNTVAAINYIKSRYGDISNVPGIKSMLTGGAYRGYAIGDRITEPQIAAFAENGWPEYAITTEPTYRARSLGLYEQLGTELGVNDTSNESPITDHKLEVLNINAIVSTLQTALNNLHLKIEALPIYFDSEKVTDVIFKPMDTKQGRTAHRTALNGGVRI